MNTGRRNLLVRMTWQVWLESTMRDNKCISGALDAGKVASCIHAVCWGWEDCHISTILSSWPHSASPRHHQGLRGDVPFRRLFPSDMAPGVHFGSILEAECRSEDWVTILLMQLGFPQPRVRWRSDARGGGTSPSISNGACAQAPLIVSTHADFAKAC